MNAWKSFESLSHSDKIRFFEVLLSDTKEASANQDETHEVCSSEKSSLNNFLENLKRACSGNSPESNSQVRDSKKKQKTLDGWVIKRNNSSSSKGKVGQSSSQNTVESDARSHSDNLSDVFSSPESNVVQSSSQNTVESDVRSHSDNLSEMCSSSESKVGQSCQITVESDVRSLSGHVSETYLYPDHLAASNLENLNSSNFINSVLEEGKIGSRNTKLTHKSTTNKDVSLKNVQTVCSKEVETNDIIIEKYNLRSKRKAYEQFPIAEDDNRDVKHLKSTNIQHDHSCTTNDDETADNAHTNIDNHSHSYGQSVEENDLHIKDKSVEKKNSYKMRTKKKNTKLQQPIEVNNSLVVDGKLDNKVKDRLTNNNESSLTSLRSNFEAFCKLSRQCTSAGLNILDILQDKKIQIMLNNHKSLCNDAVVFIGSFKSNNMGKMLPVVHVAHSKKKLLESLTEIQEIK